MTTTGRRKKMIYIFTILATAYLVILFTFYLFANRLIYQRTQLKREYSFDFPIPFKEYFITTPDNVTLNAIHFPAPTRSKGLIFYLHGNADDLRRWGTYAVDFTSLGYDVFMMDYRGYGKSTGHPEENLLHQDAAFVLNWVETNISPEEIIIYGRSLGSALASQLAVKAAPRLLILETPFAEFRDVIPFPLKPAFYLFPMKATFSNLKALTSVNCQKVIFHGTNDWVVPLSSAEKLKPILGPDDEFVVIDGGGHKNLRDFKLYHDKLRALLP